MSVQYTVSNTENQAGSRYTSVIGYTCLTRLCMYVCLCVMAATPLMGACSAHPNGMNRGSEVQGNLVIMVIAVSTMIGGKGAGRRGD